MKFFFDTEFLEDGKTIELISIGIVAEDGRTYYAESVEFDERKASPWLRVNVMPLLDRVPNENGVTTINSRKTINGAAINHLRTRKVIAREIEQFVGYGHDIEFWAYYGSYDWVALCQLFGRMIDLPPSFPIYVHDLKQFAGDIRLPEQATPKHHALNDALWTRSAWLHVVEMNEYRKLPS